MVRKNSFNLCRFFFLDMHWKSSIPDCSTRKKKNQSFNLELDGVFTNLKLCSAQIQTLTQSLDKLCTSTPRATLYVKGTGFRGCDLPVEKSPSVVEVIGRGSSIQGVAWTATLQSLHVPISVSLAATCSQ